MADLLSSGALLATILSLFYTLWYPEIRYGLDHLKPKTHAIDSKNDIELLRAIIKRRVGPLLIGSALVTSALLPDGARVIGVSAEAMRSPSAAYDAVATLFLLMIGLLIALVIHVTATLADCRALLRRLEHR